MAINLTTKFSGIVSEVFKSGVTSSVLVNSEYDQDWVGADTVKIYTLVSQSLNDYSRTAASGRFGALSEVQDTVQTLQVSLDKSFNAAIDRGNEIDTATGVRNPEAFLATQLREQIEPLVDSTRYAAIAAAATPSTDTITSSNAYSTLARDLSAVADAEVPYEGLYIIATPTFVSKLKQDPAFIKSGDVSQDMLVRGMVGMVDGVPVLQVPSGRLPANTNYMIAHRTALISPTKLTTYRILQPGDSENIDGWIIQGRIIFDAFVLASKLASIKHSKSA